MATKEHREHKGSDQESFVLSQLWPTFVISVPFRG